MGQKEGWIKRVHAFSGAASLEALLLSGVCYGGASTSLHGAVAGGGYMGGELAYVGPQNQASPEARPLASPTHLAQHRPLACFMGVPSGGRGPSGSAGLVGLLKDVASYT